MRNVLPLRPKAIDNLLAGDEPCQTHLRDRGLGTLAIRQPRGILYSAVYEILEVLKKVVVEGGLVAEVLGEIENAKRA
jgi:hypothetical protein